MIKNSKLICVAILVTFATAKNYPNKNYHETYVDRINREQNSWKAEINEITKKGEAYVKRLLGANVLENSNDRNLIQHFDARFHNNYAHWPIHVPERFDARKRWPKCDSIFSIKTQGDCLSSWAVAATSVASDRLCISSNFKIKLNISAENLLTCCENCVDSGKKGCDGGHPEEAWTYLEHTGLVTGGDYQSNEGCQPYEIPPGSQEKKFPTPECKRTCTNKNYDIPFRRDRHYAKFFYTCCQNLTLIPLMQYDIIDSGPAEAVFMVYDDFPFYKSGVYHRSSSSKALGPHAVRILGWGREKGLNYWLVANSWGREWGDNGTFKIRRGTNECLFESNIIGGLFDEQTILFNHGPKME